MKVVKWIAIVLFALVGILVVVGLCMPREWSVERSVVVNAEPARIHPLVGNLESWPKWMPWLEDDPAMKLAFEGQAGQAGSRMSWTSEKMGNGRLIVERSDPATGLEYEMTMEEMTEPARGSIRYTPEGGATRVTWKDSGNLGGNPFMRLLRPVMEGVMAHYMDRGLAKVESLAEAG